MPDIPCITIVPTEALKEQASNFDKEFLPESVAEEFAKSFYEEKAACLIRKDIKKKCEDELLSKEIQKIKKSNELKKRMNIEERSTENVTISEKEIKQEVTRYTENFKNEHKDKKDYKIDYEYGDSGGWEKQHYSWKEFQTDRRYITATFKDAFQYAWKALNSTYGQDKTCLICIDEAPNLKSNAVYLARAKEISQYHPTAVFTATPDKFLSEEFNISNHILLSPTERAELGIGKLPRVYSKSQSEGIVEAYIKKVDNTHEKLSSCDNAIAKFKEERKKTSDLSDLFLNLINESLDSQVYKTTLIATEKKDWLDIQCTIRSRGNEQNRKEEIKKSFVNAIRELESGLEDNQIESLVNENLNIEVGDKLHRSIKLHNIIDTFNEYKKSKMEVTEEKVSKFIEDKYGIIDYVHPEYSNENLLYNTELTRSICTLNTIQGKYKKSIERNYPGDKKLHEYIFKTYSKLTAFCKEDLHLSYFQGNFGSRNESKRDENRLNMVKAGFVPITFSKELGIGIDAPRLNRAAVIITSPSDMSDPMFLLQFIGRIGRDINSKGLCYFDLFTATKNFLNVSNVAELSGKDLNKELLSNHQEYITDMNYIIETKSRALCDFIIEMIKNYDQEERKGSYISGVESYIIKEFNNINVSYGFNKEVSLKLFTKVLNSAYSELENFYTHEVITNNGINDVIKILKSQDANIEVKRIGNYNSIPSLVLWAKKIIQIQPICGNELLNADPGPRDVFGKLLDANLESEDPIFVKSDSEDKYKRITEDIESYTYEPRDIKVEKLSPAEQRAKHLSFRKEYAKKYGRVDHIQKTLEGLKSGKNTTEEAINKIKQLNINYVNPDENVKGIIYFGCAYLEILDFFIESGLNVNDERLNLIISLCNSTRTNPKALEVLIKKGANVDVKDEHGNTPLHLACKNGCIELAKILIKNQANVTSENKEGHTPLYLAAQNADLSCAKFLIECLLEADLNREMPPLLNEDRELLEHWNSCKNHIIKPAEEEFVNYFSYKNLGKSFTFSDNIPLVFQWLPKTLGFKDRREIFEKYLIRLSNWSKLEPQRRIKLVINGSGFEENQKKELEEKISNTEFNPNQNIDIIDFNYLDLSEHDFNFSLSGSDYKLSSYFKNLYSIPEEKRMGFGAEIDIMRKFALLSLKEPLIYFDFDILSHQDGRKIGNVIAKKGLLVADGNEATFENSIIATYPGEPLFLHICEKIKHKIKTEPHTLTDNSIYDVFSGVLKSFQEEIMLDKNLFSQLQEGLLTNEDKRRDPFEVIRQVIKQFQFQENGGNVIVTRDRSWEESTPKNPQRITNEKDELKVKNNVSFNKSAVYFTIAAALSALIITAAFLTQTYIILAALIIPTIIGLYGWSLYKEENKPDSKLQENIELENISTLEREAEG